MSKIVVVEGPDRVGKQTQTRLLKDHVEKLGLRAEIIEVPIKSAVTYKVIYWMLHNGLAKKLPKTFQWFQYLNRKIFQIFTLPHLEQQNDVLILDRWSLSTIIYGGAEGVPESFAIGLSKKLRDPDHTVILSGDAFPHEAEDAYEADSDLQKKVRIGYARWAAANPETTTLIGCHQERGEILKKIKTILEDKGIIPRW